MVLSEISVSLACNFAATTEPAAVVAVAAAVVADPNVGRIFIPTTSRLMPRRPSTPVANPINSTPHYNESLLVARKNHEE